jgi:hypothetical protein
MFMDHQNEYCKNETAISLKVINRFMYPAINSKDIIQRTRKQAILKFIQQNNRP